MRDGGARCAPPSARLSEVAGTFFGSFWVSKEHLKSRDAVESVKRRMVARNGSGNKEEKEQFIVFTPATMVYLPCMYLQSVLKFVTGVSLFWEETPMKYLSYGERAFCGHLSRVRHVTLDPDRPGVVRIHLIPCTKPDRDTPFVAILNEARIFCRSTSAGPFC